MISESVIEAKFLRSKANLSFTKLWSQIDDARKTVILSHIDFSTGEIPIITYFKDDSHWWLISTESLYIRDGNIFNLPFKQLVKVDVMELFTSKTAKIELTNLDLYTKNEHLKLFVERLSWPIIYSILLFAIKKEKTR